MNEYNATNLFQVDRHELFPDFTDSTNITINIYMKIRTLMFRRGILCVYVRVYEVDGHDSSARLKEAFIKLWHWVITFYLCYFRF